MISSKRVVKFKEGERIPIRAVFLFTEVIKENYKESTHTWENVRYFYYEVFE